MRFPALPNARFYSIRSNGSGTPDSASIWNTIASRSTWIERNKSRACGWVEGETQSGAISGAGQYELGIALLPPVGNGTGAATAYAYVNAAASTEVVVYAQLGQWSPTGFVAGGFGSATEYAIATVNSIAEGWHSVNFTVDEETTNAIRFFAIAEEATGENPAANATIETIAVLARQVSAMPAPEDGESIPATWPKLSQAACSAADEPDDVHTIRRLRQQQSHVAAKYPRVLCQHSFADLTVTTGSSQTKTAKYVVPRGPENGDVTMRFLATATAGVGDITVDIKVYVDPYGDGGTTQVGSTTNVGITSAWTSFTATGFAADAVNEVWVSLLNRDQTGSWSSGTVLYVSAEEAEYTAADFVVSGESTPTGYDVARYEPGQPIVGEHTGREDDRLSLAETCTFQGLRRSQTLLADRTTPQASTASAYPATQWGAKLRTSYGARSVEVWALVKRTSVDDVATRIPRLALWKDSAVVSDTLLNFAALTTTDGVPSYGAVARQNGGVMPEDLVPVWVRVGQVAVTEATQYEWLVRTGFVNSVGTGAGATTDEVQVLGVLFREHCLGTA
jgi:hypothetical protein